MISESIARIVRDKFSLTPREAEIFKLLLKGKTSTKELSRELNISVSTVDRHLESICTRTGLSGRTDVLRSLIIAMGNLLEESYSSGRLIHQPPHVIVYDDDVDTSDLLASMLADRGVKAQKMEGTPSELVLNTKWDEIDVLLIDYVLPNTTGIVVAGQVSDHTPMAPSTLLITGFPEMLEAGNNSNVASCLFKPIDVEPLLSQVEALTMQRRLKKNLDRAFQAIRAAS